MIVAEEEILERLHSPLNLINRLRESTAAPAKRASAMGLFGLRNNKNEAFKNPFGTPSESATTALTVRDTASPESFPINAETADQNNHPENKVGEDTNTAPKLDSLLDNADNRIKLATAHKEALGLLVDSVTVMKAKLDDIKPDKLPSVMSAAAKVVNDIQRQQLEEKKSRAAGNQQVHLHFYTPTQKKIEEYTTIEVG